MKINISMNDRLVEQVDKVAEKIFTTRSGFIAFACAYYIQTMHNNKIPSLHELSEGDGKERK